MEDCKTMTPLEKLEYLHDRLSGMNKKERGELSVLKVTRRGEYSVSLNCVLQDIDLHIDALLKGDFYTLREIETEFLYHNYREYLNAAYKRVITNS